MKVNGPELPSRGADRWLSAVSIARKLYLISLVAVPVVILVFVATILAMGMLSGLRGYVAGEGLYSKYQKDAVFHLQRYIHDPSEEIFRRYLDSIRVPLADGNARRALDAGDFDRAATHFREGLNAPEDIRWIIFIYRHLQGVSYVKHAVSLWVAADARVDQIVGLADEIRRELRSENPSWEILEQNERELERLNQDLIVIEDEFSRTIGEAYRWGSGVLVQAIGFFGFALLAAGVLFARIVSRHVSREVDAVAAGVAQMTGGDLTARVNLDSRDELGRLAEAVNRMAESLEKGQEDVLRAHSLLAATLDSTADGILVIDRDGKVVSYNRRFAEMWRLPDEVLQSRDDVRAMRHVLAEVADPEAFVARVRELYESPGAESRDLIEFRDGRVFDRFSRPQSVSGEIVGRVWSFRDITAAKVAERELREAREAAESASQAKSRFLANVSHDLRTPLGSVIGVADLLAESASTGDQKEYVETLQRSSKLLLNLIDQVLDLSKVESGRLELERVEFDLEELVEDVRRPLGFRARTRGLDFRCDVAAGAPRRLVGDPKRLAQVLVNIVGNAIKFTESGFVRIAVDGSVTGPGEAELRFSVEDTGPGIAKETQSRIFESFTQLDSSINRRFGGAGLGLAISKRLVEHMGGEISVDSEPGSGSTFRFSVRLGLARPAIAPGKLSRASVVHLDQAVRVLLVEDSADNVALIRLYLRQEPVDLAVAGNGEEGFRTFREGEFDLVLMDLQMPVMDGYDSTRGIREWEKEQGREPTPILAFTAHATVQDRDKSRKAGCDGYLTKPIKKQQLLDAIRAYGADPGRSRAASSVCA